MRWFLDVEPFRRDPLQFLLDRTFGFPEGLEELALGPQAYYLVTDPKLARQILKSDEDFIDKGRLVRKLRPLIGKSHLTLSGEEHRKRRNVLHNQLARGVANRYVGAMSAVIRRTAAGMMRERRFDAHEITGPLAVSLASVALFGDNVLSAGDRQVLVGAMKSIEDEIAAEMFRAWPHAPWSYFTLRKRRKPALDAMSFVVQRIRKNAAESSILRSLETLDLTNEQIRDEILTMLLAGHHTTGTAGAWILYHLAVQPGLADAIAQEMREITDRDGEVVPSRTNDAKMSLALVREVLRLYPSAWWFSREVRRTVTLANRKLRPGTSLIISPWQMHRDSRFWNDPHTFSIDRHYGDAYMPFGAGPRACVGMGVAMLELQLLSLEIAASVELSAASPTPAPWPTPSVTLVPPRIVLEASVRPDTARARSAA